MKTQRSQLFWLFSLVTFLLVVSSCTKQKAESQKTSSPDIRTEQVPGPSEELKAKVEAFFHQDKLCTKENIEKSSGLLDELASEIKKNLALLSEPNRRDRVSAPYAGIKTKLTSFQTACQEQLNKPVPVFNPQHYGELKIQLDAILSKAGCSEDDQNKLATISKAIPNAKEEDLRNARSGEEESQVRKLYEQLGSNLIMALKSCEDQENSEIRREEEKLQWTIAQLKDAVADLTSKSSCTEENEARALALGKKLESISAAISANTKIKNGQKYSKQLPAVQEQLQYYLDFCSQIRSQRDQEVSFAEKFNRLANLSTSDTCTVANFYRNVSNLKKMEELFSDYQTLRKKFGNFPRYNEKFISATKELKAQIRECREIYDKWPNATGSPTKLQVTILKNKFGLFSEGLETCSIADIKEAKKLYSFLDQGLESDQHWVNEGELTAPELKALYAKLKAGLKGYLESCKAEIEPPVIPKNESEIEIVLDKPIQLREFKSVNHPKQNTEVRALGKAITLPKGAKIKVILTKGQFGQYTIENGITKYPNHSFFLVRIEASGEISKEQIAEWNAKGLYADIHDLNEKFIVNNLYNQSIPAGKNKVNYKFKWDHFNPSGTWAYYIREGLNRDYNKHLIETSPSDMKDFCPQFAHITKEQREIFWIATLVELSELESDFNPTTTFNEGQFDKHSEGVMSSGLTQISLGSLGGYKAKSPECRAINSQADLYNMELNLGCTVGIISQLVKSGGCIACSKKDAKGELDYYGMPRYWSTLKTPYQKECRDCANGKQAELGKKYVIIEELKTSIPFCFKQK